MNKTIIFLEKEKKHYRCKIERLEIVKKECTDTLQSAPNEHIKKKLDDTEAALCRCRELLKYIESLKQQNK